MNEDGLELSEETINDINRSREEFKKGKYYTLEEIKRSLKN